MASRCNVLGRCRRVRPQARLFLSSVVAPVPLYKASDSFIDRRRGPETDGPCEIGDICIRGHNIARLELAKVLDRFSAKMALQEVNQLCQLDRVVVPDVVESVRGVARRRV